MEALPGSEGLPILAWRAGPAPQTIRMAGHLCCEPLELEYLDTVLADHRVTLLDGLSDSTDPVALARRIEARIVLISCCITNTALALDVARRLKKLPLPPLVFVGGPHFEVVPGHGMVEGVDGVFFADALEGVREVLDRVRQGRPYQDVPGAAFPRAGTWVRNSGPPLDPARLPIPRRRLLEQNPSLYRYMYHGPCATVKTAFGCPGRCTFCFCAEMNQGRYGPRPLDAVVAEITALSTPSIFLVDDDFFADPHRVRDFAARVRPLGKSFVAYGAVRSLLRDPGALVAFRESGLDALIVGLEFVTDDALATFQKRTTSSDNDRVLALCREAGVEVFALFMVDPDWHHADFRRLARYVRERRLSFATFSTLQAFPGTKLGGAVGPLTEPWRFDLLRLPHPPAHVSPAAYYLWLFYLYLLPGLRPSALRTLGRRYGVWGTMGLLVRSSLVGLDYFGRLLFRS